MTRVRGSPPARAQGGADGPERWTVFRGDGRPGRMGRPGWSEVAPRGSEEETTMTNPTPERPRDVADMPPEERERQYHAAMAAADVDAAEVSFAGRCPRTGPKDVRRPWGRGGTWSPCSGGSTEPAERPHERADGAATSPHIILEIEAAAKERGETVSGWRRPRSSRPWRWRAGTTRSSGGLRPRRLCPRPGRPSGCATKPSAAPVSLTQTDRRNSAQVQR